MTIDVVIADDQALLRSGFKVLIDAAPDMNVVAEAPNGLEAVRLCSKHHPDVVLMDIRMPVLDGIAATSQITGNPKLADIKVLILTTFDLDEYVYEALRRGASGFLLKDTAPDELLSAIRVIAAGEALLAPKVTRSVIEAFARQRITNTSNASEALKSLTEREMEVLIHVAKGLSNAEIATQLHMSYATAKTHVGHLLAKLGARDRAQLVVVAYETKLVTPS